jgi:L-aspartate oxidase
MENIEVLIIGCGIAGATAALRLARNPERQITIITRAPDVHESNTRYAQGGIIGRGPDDSSELLFEDIVAAGAGVSSPKAARILADEGPQLLNEVLERTAGVVFDHTAEGAPVWGQEAAHSRRRILHVGDATGRAIMRGLVAALNDRPNITIKSEATAVDLITFPHH